MTETLNQPECLRDRQSSEGTIAGPQYSEGARISLVSSLSLVIQSMGSATVYAVLFGSRARA